MFLACIAKALTVQTKVKGQASGKGTSFGLNDMLPAGVRLPGRWWLRGTISAKQAESIITLLKDMTEVSGSGDCESKGSKLQRIGLLDRFCSIIQSKVPM